MVLLPRGVLQGCCASKLLQIQIRESMAELNAGLEPEDEATAPLHENPCLSLDVFENPRDWEREI